MTITHIQLVSRPVSDQERAKSFYVDVLGFKLIRENPMGPDHTWVQVGLEGQSTSLVLATWFPSMTPGSSKGMVLETDDLDGDIKRLRDKGVTFNGDVEEEPWGRFITLDDPDGNGIILQATADGLE
ncbi:glyoxalase superfamily protein [Nocardia sp. NBC_01499]|uniref:glyoxalase superfamily protein n=1 Tax=Nocardia sp. NBC_01499 TaxID=2903597 RepID=UPI00386754A9